MRFFAALVLCLVMNYSRPIFYIRTLHPNTCSECGARGARGAEQVFSDGKPHTTNRICPICNRAWLSPHSLQPRR